MFELNNGETVGTRNSDDKYLLSKKLVEMTEALGHSPSFEEIRQCPEMPRDPNIYAFYFGSLDKARKEAEGYISVTEHDESLAKHEASSMRRSIESAKFQMSHIRQRAKESKQFRRCNMGKREEIMERALELCHKYGGGVKWISENSVKQDSILVYHEVISVFGSVKKFRGEVYQELRKKVNRKPTEEKCSEEGAGEASKRKGRQLKSDEELWAEVREKAKSLGRVPMIKDIVDDPNMSTPQTYYLRLGKDWRKVLATELGLEQPRTKSKRNATSEEQNSEPSVSEESLESEEPSKLEGPPSSEDLSEPEELMKPEDLQGPEETPRQVKRFEPAEMPETKEPTEMSETIEIAEVMDVKQPTSTEETNEMMVLPIKIILPKGVKGTVQINLDF